MIFLYSVVVISPCMWTGSTPCTGSSAWADRVCGLEEIELEHQQVRRPELLPEEFHIQPEGAVHRGTTSARAHTPSCPLVVRDLREVCWLGGSSPSSARRS